MKNTIKFSKTQTEGGHNEILKTCDSKCGRFSVSQIITFDEDYGVRKNVRKDHWTLLDRASGQAREIYSSPKLSDCKKYANQKVQTEQDNKEMFRVRDEKILKERGGKTDQERDQLIEQLLIKVQVENRPQAFTEDELDRYEAWLLMQKDFVLVNKIVF